MSQEAPVVQKLRNISQCQKRSQQVPFGVVEALDCIPKNGKSGQYYVICVIWSEKNEKSHLNRARFATKCGDQMPAFLLSCSRSFPDQHK